ncbi:hypothetical protein HY479_01670 [Candidatus Uhrbacteria bacterium]|nr:hypothetical protein [Candidatus Uhrbacteria bacterium]
MKLNGIRIFTGLVVLAVASAVIAGFLTSGSPSSERARRLDQQRLSDLQQISFSVDTYWSLYKRLPENIDALQRERNVYLGNVMDPETGDAYGYRAVATSTYELCAAFATDNTAEMPKPAYAPPGQKFWDHSSGPKCYTLEVLIQTAAPAFKD